MRFRLEEERKKKRKWRDGLSITPFVTQKKDNEKEAGDVEKGIDNFNAKMTTGNPTGSAAGGTATAGGMGESLLKESKEQYLKDNGYIINKKYGSNYFKVTKDGETFTVLFDTEDREVNRSRPTKIPDEAIWVKDHFELNGEILEGPYYYTKSGYNETRNIVKDSGKTFTSTLDHTFNNLNDLGNQINSRKKYRRIK